MPRKGPIPKREILPDPKYGNCLLYTSDAADE